MAQWDITVDAGSDVGSGSTNDQAITEPADFDGATINSVTILGTPTATTDGATDDTISVNFYVSTDAAVDVYGTNTVAGALATFTFGDSVSAPQNIVVGASTSPAPTTAVAADWDQMRMRVIYSANKMGDNETVSWSSFQVRVDYTPVPDIQQDHYRFTTPITGSAHEAWTLVGTEDNSYEITLDDDYGLIIKISNRGGSDTGAETWQLEANVDGAGWNDVTGASTNVRATASGDTDGATSATERLTTSARSFGGTVLDEVDGAVSDDAQAGNDYEYYFAITFRSADLSGGESIDLRIRNATETITYNVTANATVPVPETDLAAQGIVVIH